jgi:acetyl-CoA synthetase
LYLFTNDPELAVSILACARIGATFRCFLPDFQPPAVASRIIDSECKMVHLMVDIVVIKQSQVIDEALENAHQ